MLLKSRGVRNHNPGNIRFNPANHWQGRADWTRRTPEQQTENEFEVFIAPEWGIRAMAVLLINYFDKVGTRTIRQIITRWAPSNENDTSSYVLSVSSRMNINPDLLLDLHDYRYLRPLVEAIISHENGVQPYSKDLIDKGLGMAGVAADMPPLTQSRTMIGVTAASVGTAGSAVVETVHSIDLARHSLAPLQDVLPWVKYLMVALVIGGLILAGYARWQDSTRRVT